MSGSDVTIVGVMPTDGMSVEPGRLFDIAVPMMLSSPSVLRDRGDWWLDVVARLKPGVEPEHARAETDALFQAYMADGAMSREARRLAFDHIELSPAARGLDGLRRQYGAALRVLMVLAALVLMAACANVANLMLARATAREREFAVRLAIGAGRGRLVRQTLAEAMVLVGGASVLGIVLAMQGKRVLAAVFATAGRHLVLDLSLNLRMLVYTIGVSIATGLAFALLPAVRAAGADPAAGLQGASRSVAGHRRSLRVGRTLMVLQVSLSTVLLAGAGLFLRSLERLQGLDPGFTASGVLTMEVAPERAQAGTAAWLALQQRLLERVRALPGVQAASWSTMSPFSGRDRGTGFYVPGFVSRAPRATEVHLVSVSAGILRDLRHPPDGRACLHRQRHRDSAQGRHRQRVDRALLLRRFETLSARWWPSRRRTNPTIASSVSSRTRGTTACARQSAGSSTCRSRNRSTEPVSTGWR